MEEKEIKSMTKQEKKKEAKKLRFLWKLTGILFILTIFFSIILIFVLKPENNSPLVILLGIITFIFIIPPCAVIFFILEIMGWRIKRVLVKSSLLFSDYNWQLLFIYPEYLSYLDGKISFKKLKNNMNKHFPKRKKSLFNPGFLSKK